MSEYKYPYIADKNQKSEIEAVRNMPNSEIETYIRAAYKRETNRSVLRERIIEGKTYREIIEKHYFCERQTERVIRARIQRMETIFYRVVRTNRHRSRGRRRMMDKINDERLFKEILQGVRNSGSEGLYSFLIGIGGGGTAYVECRCGEVFVQAVTFCEGKEKTERFVGTAVAATNFLLMRDADFSTISNRVAYDSSD